MKIKNAFKGFLVAVVTLCLVGILRFLVSILSAEIVCAALVFAIVWWFSTMIFSGDEDSYD